MNAMIYWDKAKSENQLADTLAGGYLSTAESKIAPLLVSGSWVGWLMFEEVKKIENIKLAQGFIFSRCGFTREAEDYCKENGIACSEDERWLGSRETGRRL